MRDCLELIGNIVAIHLLPLGTATFPMPFNVQAPSVQASAITIGGLAMTLDNLKKTRCLALEDYLIYNSPKDSVEVETGISVKETSKLVAAGTYYTTKISCRSYDAVESIRQLVYDMTAVEAFDAFVVDSEDRVFLLRGVEPATSIDMQASLPVSTTSSIELQVASVNGLQRVVF